ncbi:MAG: bifunctional alpha,alpha-trehalose-phosphate synthase (UDP-forming)/trehalose-phosphatase [Actinomycetota bacterium]|nr:bifunctional alpha,alpha-trehalose-phosphate synthase (UDP-forming)/trehalose-phosphatase [Actinomycetota bacterium]
MPRLILVSNRLPVTVERRKGELSFKGSVGGVATGLGSYHNTHESLWVGWADIASGRLDAEDREIVRTRLREEHSCVPVFLTADDVRGYYHGFSNRTLWPLLHHFAQYAEFDPRMWQAYERVNRKFRDAVLEITKPGDIIWVQDYQLMLLPKMLRDELPEATIGFFMHIPFPSFEVFRMLPWRRELLEGLLGADLVGFHTYDYVRHFLGSARRLLGTEDQYGRVSVDERLVLVDAFPMGIDYDRYADGVASKRAQREIETIRTRTQNRKLVLSVDRLDYTKGIPERLRTFEALLDRHPSWRGRVSLMLVAVPSRTRVEQYRELKREVDELVGSINGAYSTLEWTPVRYHYRSLPFHMLVGTYGAADVALVTPLRDGMNLIAKEYVATCIDGIGVLVLSEMAGAAKELAEAVLVNPNDRDAMVEALLEALTMAPDEQRARNEAMQRRLRRYTVQRWAEDFLGRLQEIKLTQVGFGAHLLDEWATERMLTEFRDASRRLLLLDYDGTLVGFSKRPEDARPPTEVLELLAGLAADPRNEVVVISGRDRETLDDWLGDLHVDLVAEHGVWIKGRRGEWVTIEPMNADWKDRVRPVLEMYVDRTPGTFVEEKDFSLVWHFRAVDRGLGETRVRELKEELVSVVGDYGLAAMEGNKVLEVKAAGVNKGRAAHRWMCREDACFTVVFGDDRTDEDVFEVAADMKWTVKVGTGPTRAHWSVRSYRDVRELLARMLKGDAK